MNKRIMKLSLILSTLALLWSLGFMAQDISTQRVFADKGIKRNSVATHKRYILKDLGTLGGPSSGLSFFAGILNNRGTVVGDADTSIPDPFAPNCLGPNCFVSHGFKWENDIKTDLGTLPGGSSSDVNYINELGQITGRSENGLIDPLTGVPATVAVLWNENGEIIDLGTLGGNQGLAVGINNSGHVIGAATNTIPDDFSFFGIFAGFASATQTRAFLWQNGVMRDLGTLGGPDAFAEYVNERGQVAGFSYTDSTPNDTTGLPTVHTFLWENGRMTDLGNLGGTFGIVNDMNSRGQVIGNMTLLGDESQHPFLWDRGRLIDLGTFGGSNGDASWMNDAGEVVGVADFPGDLLHDAFLWKNGVMVDLGNLGKTSTAFSINSNGQVVGASRVKPGDIRAFLWEDGGPMIDLNTLIPADSSLQLVRALSINDRGEIAGIGVPPGVPAQDEETNGHAFLLIPIEGDDAEDISTADFSPVRQYGDIGQVDNEGTTPARRGNAITDWELGPSRVRQVIVNQTRFSRFPLGRGKTD
jgi:probable HAF family extracellular repeat protein